MDERSPLITNGPPNGQVNGNPSLSASSRPPNAADVERSNRDRSRSSFRERLSSLDASFFSPATPIHPQRKDSPDGNVLKPHQPRSWTHAILFNGTAILVVVASGVAGYYLSPATPETERSTSPADEQAKSLKLNVWGQVFGYVCAVLYLGSRVPQLLLNYRRKSTEGLNALVACPEHHDLLLRADSIAPEQFFMFACLGNLTYVLSILAFEPICSRHSRGHWRESHCRSGEAASIYGQYILVNLSWLIGSLGTLFLDGAVFIQFWMYQAGSEAVVDDEARGRIVVER